MSVERWRPESEADIEAAIEAGLLSETHYFEVKQEAPNNRDLARALVSFALDGGSLLLGVAEDRESRTWSLAPSALAGLPERVEMIAASACDPPLYVVTSEIQSGTDSSIGYLLVDVPPSARAPHMVDGTYFGRGDRTRTRLSDADVIRLHAARQDMLDLGDRLLRNEIARDPVDTDVRQNGHLFLVGQPLTAVRDVAREVVRGDNQEVWRLIQTSESQIPPYIREYAPTPGSAQAYVSRARGVALCTESLREGRQFVPGESFGARSAEDYLVDIEFREDGGVRGFIGRLTSIYTAYEEPFTTVLDGLAVAYVRRLVGWTEALAEKTGYRGSWVLGIAGNGLRGLDSNTHHAGHHYGPRYDEDEYLESTTASLAEIRDRPKEVVERLIGPLLRGLGTYDHFRTHLE